MQDQLHEPKKIPEYSLIAISLVLLLTLAYSVYPIMVTKQGTQQVYISIADRPLVPQRTTSLVPIYSALTVHADTPSGNSFKVQVNSAWSLHLFQLYKMNLSQVVAVTELLSGANITGVTLYIQSVNITVNGETFAVSLPTSEVTLYLSSSAEGG